jgi:hypothetical protein
MERRKKKYDYNKGLLYSENLTKKIYQPGAID